MKVVKEKEKKNYIKPEQLAKIKSQQKDLSDLLTNIGMLESQKHSHLHRIADVNRSVEEFKLELQKEYGDININVEDGSYAFLEKEENKE